MFKNSIINHETCEDCLWQCRDADLRERRDARQSYFENSGALLYFCRASQGHLVYGLASLLGSCVSEKYTLSRFRAFD